MTTPSIPHPERPMHEAPIDSRTYVEAAMRYRSEPSDPPELVVLLARLRALVARMARRPSAVHHEILALLDGAFEAGRREVQAAGASTPCPLKHAADALNTGIARLTQFEQARNRLRYLIGLGLGVLVVVLLPALIAVPLLGSVSITEHVASLVTPATYPADASSSSAFPASSRLFAQVVIFAGFGAIASVITRLPSIDLSGETKTTIVVLSGAGRPVLAVLFAAVIYEIIAHGIITLGATSDPGVRAAYVSVAAFLCGFSERFATDIIDRLPFASGARGVSAVPLPAMSPRAR